MKPLVPQRFAKRCLEDWVCASFGLRLGLGQGCVSRLAIERYCTANISVLKCTKALFISISHDLIPSVGMVETYGVADFMSEGITQIVPSEIAIETDLPAPGGVQAYERSGDRLDGFGRSGIVKDICESPALRLDLSTDRKYRLVPLRALREK